MSVQSSNNRGNTWFDIRGIQGDKMVDKDVREVIMGQFRRSIVLIPPADVVNLGLGLSSVPGVDMSGDSGEVLAELQETNTALAEQNNRMAARIAQLQAPNP
ncbi:MAG: hypothetical protein QF535_06365 [Anaerolineales bacterium]|jgi:hypothetical protein|nr:hypothetical protein [Anaerolineales bacterium]|tara:strand:- start:200 stop:505 length:306 start_codon:yes stop_codon:yes gene_type:complete